MFGQKKSDMTEAVLFTLGAISAQYQYLLLVSIGTTADGLGSEVYTPEIALQLFREYYQMADISKKTIDDLIGTNNLDQDDTEYFQSMIENLSLLLKTAESIIHFINSDDEDFINDFESYRIEATKKIFALLKLPLPEGL